MLEFTAKAVNVNFLLLLSNLQKIDITIFLKGTCVAMQHSVDYAPQHKAAAMTGTYLKWLGRMGFATDRTSPDVNLGSLVLLESP
jgi:hypothetical protein